MDEKEQKLAEDKEQKPAEKQTLAEEFGNKTLTRTEVAGRIWKHYKADFEALALRWVDVHDADDVMQEFYIRLSRDNTYEHRDTPSFEAYLTSIFYFTLREFMRKDSRGELAYSISVSAVEELSRGRLQPEGVAVLQQMVGKIFQTKRAVRDCFQRLFKKAQSALSPDLKAVIPNFKANIADYLSKTNRPGLPEVALTPYVNGAENVEEAGRMKEHMTEVERVIVNGKYTKGLSSEEVGAQIGMKGGTIDTKLFRLRKRLRELFGPG